MKVLLTLVLIMISEAHAANALLMCLGSEEKRLHQEKETGPIYDLNQRLTAEMIQIPEVTITAEDYKSVCKSNRPSESWKLLELSLRKGKGLFVIPPSISGVQRQITTGMIEDYISASKEILLNFISQVQTQSPTPNCLLEEIPELNKFFTEIKYLREDMDIRKIMKGKDEKIFDRIKDYRTAFQRCRERLRKKARSGSTAEEKKP